MGLTITSFPIINGVATVDNVYVNIRDIKTTKQNIDNNAEPYELEFIYYAKKENNNLEAKLIRKTSTEAFIGNLWDLAYQHLKEELTNKSLEFVDSI